MFADWSSRGWNSKSGSDRSESVRKARDWREKDKLQQVRKFGQSDTFFFLLLKLCRWNIFPIVA